MKLKLFKKYGNLKYTIKINANNPVVSWNIFITV